MSKPTQEVPVIPTVDKTAVAKETPAPEEKKELMSLTEDGPVTAPALQTGQPDPTAPLERIAIADMLDAKGDYVSDILMGRIKQHNEYLTGQIGFENDEKRRQEMVTFMETIGASTRMSLDQYSVVTDYLINMIRDNISEYGEGKAFRFMRGLSRTYSDSAMDMYKTYMTMLIRIAGAYANRRDIFRMMDLDTITVGMTKEARDNVNTYMRRLCA